jgi:hypothetical protein
MKKFLAFSAILVFPLLLMGAGCGTGIKEPTPSVSNIQLPVSPEFVSVKYRNDKVDIANTAFKSLNTDRSSFIRGAWYDLGNEYLIINLNGVYYQYCGLDRDTWEDFAREDSLGAAYNEYIKGGYSCNGVSVPEYPNN